MGESNDYIAEGLEEESSHGGGTAAENYAGGTGSDESAANSGESDGRGSFVTGSDTDGDGSIHNGQNGNKAVNDGNDNGDSTGQSTQGDSGKSEPGQLQTAKLGDTETSVPGDGQTVFESVTASQFDDAMQSLESQISVLNASCLVLVAALFACFGAFCVRTLIDSLHWRE